MKVALIDPSLFTTPYDLELAGGLRSIGHDALLFGKADAAGDAGGVLIPHFYGALTHPPLSKAPRAVQRVSKGLSHIAGMRALLQEFRRWRPDVIHFQWLPLPKIDQQFMRLFRRIAPLVLTVHDTTPFNGAPTSFLQTFGALGVLRDFDRLIVHTEQGRARVRGYAAEPTRVACVPHGLLYEAQAQRAAAQAVAADRLTFLLFGKIKPYKGVDVLLHALARLAPTTRAKCRVRIVGQSYVDSAALRRLAHDLGVADSVEFDFRFVDDDELNSLMASSDALLFPYREIEASGVLMAAIAHAKPIVASRIGSFAETLTDGRDALLVPPGSPEELAGALERFIADADLRRSLNAGVRGLRDEIPSWREIAQRTTDIYLAALRGWKPEGVRAPAEIVGDAA